MACKTVKEIRALTGLSQRKFEARYHIPRRTLETWESAAGNPPAYMLELLEFRVKHDPGTPGAKERQAERQAASDESD